MSVKNQICFVIGTIGGAISAALGGWDNAIITLMIFMAVDFALGLANAIFWHNSDKSENGALSSSACWKGIIKKAGKITAGICRWCNRSRNLDSFHQDCT